MAKTSPDKEAVILKLLAEGDTMLCLDARAPGVHVPPQHAQNPSLRLILNLNFPHPIDITAEGISANLSFGGRRFACYIPMEALWAAFNPDTMHGMMWPESMPPEVAADMAVQQQQEQSGAKPRPAPERKATPRVIVGKGDSTKEPDDKAPPAPRQRGHLRIVK